MECQHPSFDFSAVIAELMLTLVNIPFDLQITICKFLRPIDILALRKTCKAFGLSTRQRVVWLVALHRVCLDNTLFLPSFPIPDMSDLELEQAAIAPHRWIELCGAFKKQHPGDPGATLYPRNIRIIGNVDMPYLFLVPGGRYLVASGKKGLFVWDLGYVSYGYKRRAAYRTLIASGGVGLEGSSVYESFCMVQATPDGMGLIILVFNRFSHISIYEIYPQSETPLLTQIAHLDFNHPTLCLCHLLPDTLIFRDSHRDRIVFRFWDYRVNYSTCFSTDVKKKFFVLQPKTFATKTAIIIIFEEGILVWAIPPLFPHSADHFLNNNPTRVPPLFRIPFPDDIVSSYHDIFAWKTISSWYFGSWESIYFDIICLDSRLDRLKLIVKPDLSDASLHVINTTHLNLASFNFQDVSLQSYRICEDTLVSFWSRCFLSCGVCTGLTSAHSTGLTFARFPIDVAVAVQSRIWIADYPLCPASGRFVYFSNEDGRIVVVDLI